MSSRIKSIIDIIIQKRSNGDPLIAEMTKTKMIMKGINPDSYSSSSKDDPEVIEKLLKLAKELNINV